MEFKSTNTTIERLFDEKYNLNGDPHPSLYQIPNFQRPYAWTKDNIIEFFEDLTSDKNSTNNFIGNIVINKERYEKSGANNKTKLRYEIVDGQQRMTTIIIFASAIINYIKKNLDYRKNNDLNQLIKDIETTYLYVPRQKFTKNVSFNKDRIKFLPNSEIKKDYIKYIINYDWKEDILILKKPDSSFKNVKSNFGEFNKQIENYVQNLNDNKKAEKLNDLVTRLNQTQIILTTINDEETAYEIFETINSRGIDLNVSDLLKNYIFQSSKRNTKEIELIWNDMNYNIDNSPLARNSIFFRYYFNSKYEFVTERQLYRKIKQKISSRNVLSKLNELKDYSEILSVLDSDDLNEYKSILPDFVEKDLAKIKNSVFAMNSVFNSKQQLVLLMSLIDKKNIVGNKQLMRVLSYLEYFTFMYFSVCKLPANKVEKLYSKYAIKISALKKDKRSHNIVNNIRNDLFSDLKELIPAKEVFIDKLYKLEYSNTNRKKIKHIFKYYFSKENINKNDELDISEGITLEHVYPQSPPEKIDKQKHKSFVHKLGNLTLIGSSLNGRLNNKNITDKISELTDSRLTSTKSLANDLNSKIDKIYPKNKFDIDYYRAYVEKRTTNICLDVYSFIENEINKLY